jgi:hypothetical protein
MVDEAPYQYFLTEFRGKETQRGCAMMPKRSVDVSTTEIARFLRVLDNSVQPVKFEVPRKVGGRSCHSLMLKGDNFQEDIYCDTYAGIPSLSADEWLSGANKPPKMISLRPGARTVRDGTYDDGKYPPLAGAAPAAASTTTKPAAAPVMSPTAKPAMKPAMSLAEALKKIEELEAEVCALLRRTLLGQNAQLKEQVKNLTETQSTPPADDAAGASD